MDNIKFLDLISDYDKSIAGERPNYYEIIKKTHIKDGQMILFRTEDVISVAIAYDNGEVYVLYDWQGGYPSSIKEKDMYEWVMIANQFGPMF